MRKMALDTAGEVVYTEDSEMMPGSNFRTNAGGFFMPCHIYIHFDAQSRNDGSIQKRATVGGANCFQAIHHSDSVRFCVPGEMPR